MFVHQGKKEILYSSHRQYGKTRSHFIYFFPRAPHLMFHRSVSPFPLFSDVFSFKMTLNVTSVLPMLMTSVHCQLVDVPGTQSRSPVVSALGRSAPVTASRTSVRMRKKTLFTSPLLPPPSDTHVHTNVSAFSVLHLHLLTRKCFLRMMIVLCTAKYAPGFYSTPIFS